VKWAQSNQSPDQDLEISNPEFWNLVKFHLLQKLKELVAIAETDIQFVNDYVNDYFLFTIVGALITSQQTVTFSMGDGAIAINGELHQIPAYPDNAPPYLAYGLYKPDAVNFEIRDRLPTSELNYLLIATDGIDDLV